MLVPKVQKGDFLRTVDADGVAIVDQVARELLIADQPIEQVDLRLLNGCYIDAAQQPK